MDNEKLNIIIALVVASATLISSVYGVISFKKQKEYENMKSHLKNFIFHC